MAAGFAALGDNDIHPGGDLPHGMLARTHQCGAWNTVAAGAFQHGGWGNAECIGDQADGMTEGDIHHVFAGVELV